LGSVPISGVEGARPVGPSSPAPWMEKSMRYGLGRALFWALAFLTLALSPALVAYIGPAAPRTFWIEVGVGLGFVGLGVLVLQFLLTGRFRRVAPSFGFDSMLHFHRHIGIVALILVLGHPVVLIATDPTYLEYFDPRVDLMRALALSAVTGALLLIVITSLWRTAFRLNYEWWRVIHGVLALFIVMIGCVHAFQVGHYVSTFWAQGFIGAILAASVGLVAHTRLLRPMRLRRSPYRVRGVREERGDAYTLEIEPDGHDGLRFSAGQFGWLTLRNTPFTLQQHPYSFSSSAEAAPGRLEFTVKVEGDFSASVREVEPGQPAFIEGPYGYFVADPDPSRGCVMIVGGVGVTPCMSMLRTFADRGSKRDLHLIYANASLEEVIFLDQLRDLEQRLRLTVTHVLEEPPDDWDGETGLIDEELLERCTPPDRAEYDTFICGPEPMMNIAEASMRELGVPQRRIFSERFDIV
jgi:predicted ferric reductase